MSYGLTQSLFNFWSRCGFRPLYLRQSASDVTGEHTVVMAAPLEHPDVEGTGWLDPFVNDFKVGSGSWEDFRDLGARCGELGPGSRVMGVGH